MAIIDRTANIKQSLVQMDELVTQDNRNEIFLNANNTSGLT